MTRASQRSVEVAVATVELRDPEQLFDALGLGGQGVELLIINQLHSPEAKAPDAANGSGWRIFNYRERGLSRSRNRALSHARGDILLLADEDIRYRDGFAEVVRAEFGRYPEAAGVSFRFEERSQGALAKGYPAVAMRHSWLSVAALSSIELALQPSRLGDHRFDERFGLGAQFPSGEEAVLCSDLLRAGAELWSVPKTICSHLGASSGHRVWDAPTRQAKGALMRRLAPRSWPLWLFALAVTKYSRFGAGVSPLDWTGDLWAGAHAPELG